MVYIAELQDAEDTGPSDTSWTPTRPIRQSGGTIERLRDELDTYLEEMQEFHQMLPNEVFIRLSAMSARASELKIQLSRDDKQRSRSFKSQEIEPFLDECERQFKFHSRIQATAEMDLKMIRGQV